MAALSRALAAGTLLQWAIGTLEYCFCCRGKAGTPARLTHHGSPSAVSAPVTSRARLALCPPSKVCTPLNRY